MSDQQAMWGTDGPVSMPVPPALDVGDLVSMGGFAFCGSGLVHDLTSTDVEAVYATAYAPESGPDG